MNFSTGKEMKIIKWEQDFFFVYCRIVSAVKRVEFVIYSDERSLA